MKPFSQAVGEVCGYATGLRYDFTCKRLDNGDRLIRIESAQNPVRIECSPDREYFIVYSQRRVSIVEGKSPEDSVAYVNVREELQQLINKNPTYEVLIDPLVEQSEADAIEYVDGIQVQEYLPSTTTFP